MIVSHAHRFIFIKTEKTAGTSIEIALSKFCGPDDIITPISEEDEALRRELGYRGPQNYLAKPWEYGPQDWVRLAVKREPKARFYNHAPASHIKPRVGDDIWRSYFKFCFERNPWDRLISAYYWKGGDERRSLSDFIQSNKVLSLKRRGIDAYTIDGQIAVDRVCRHEALGEEMEAVRQRLGLPEPLNIPRAKSHTRRDKRHYRDVLSEADRTRIAQVFAPEIALMGYVY